VCTRTLTSEWRSFCGDSFLASSYQQCKSLSSPSYRTHLPRGWYLGCLLWPFATRKTKPDFVLIFPFFLLGFPGRQSQHPTHQQSYGTPRLSHGPFRGDKLVLRLSKGSTLKILNSCILRWIFKGLIPIRSPSLVISYWGFHTYYELGRHSVGCLN